MPPAVSFYTVVLAIHIMAVVVAFGVTFAYPMFDVVGLRLDPRAMPWYFRLRVAIGQRLISPGLLVVLLAGIYLASKLDVWGKFYVGWGMAVVIVLGGLGGAFFTPRERRLAEIAERDIAAAGDGPVQWSAEYEAQRRLLAIVGTASSLLVLLTIYFMAAQTGA
jgi:hypothetical protein